MGQEGQVYNGASEKAFVYQGGWPFFICQTSKNLVRIGSFIYSQSGLSNHVLSFVYVAHTGQNGL